MSTCPASGFFIESTPGDDQDHGNFEVVVTARDGGLHHYWRDNNADGYPWNGPFPIGDRLYDGVSLAESDFKTHRHNDQYNLEAIAGFNRHLSPLVSSPEILDNVWRENGGDWHWSTPTTAGHFDSIGNPSLVIERNFPTTTSRVHDIGLFRGLVLRRTGGFDTIIRDSVDYTWSVFNGHAADRMQGAAFLLSYVGTGRRGNVAAGDRYASYGDRIVAAVTEAGYLQLFRQQNSQFGANWEGPFTLGADVFAGRPSIIMSDFNEDEPSDWNPPWETAHYGNYELIAPLRAGGIAHFWKDNGTSVSSDDNNDYTRGWNAGLTFGSAVYSEVSMIQSNLGSGDNGHLEVVARTSTQTGFDFWWRDDDLVTWHGPTVVD